MKIWYHHTKVTSSQWCHAWDLAAGSSAGHLVLAWTQRDVTDLRWIAGSSPKKTRTSMLKEGLGFFNRYSDILQIIVFLKLVSVSTIYFGACEEFVYHHPRIVTTAESAPENSPSVGGRTIPQAKRHFWRGRSWVSRSGFVQKGVFYTPICGNLK